MTEMLFIYRPLHWVLLAVVMVYFGVGLTAVGLMGIGIEPHNPLGWLVVAGGTALLIAALGVAVQTVRWMWRGWRLLLR